MLFSLVIIQTKKNQISFVLFLYKKIMLTVIGIVIDIKIASIVFLDTTKLLNGFHYLIIYN